MKKKNKAKIRLIVISKYGTSPTTRYFTFNEAHKMHWHPSDSCFTDLILSKFIPPNLDICKQNQAANLRPR